MRAHCRRYECQSHMAVMRWRGAIMVDLPDRVLVLRPGRIGCSCCGLVGISWPLVQAVLLGQEQAVPGVGEEVLVALRGPAALADQELVHLGGVGGPDDVGGLVGV